MSTIKLNLRAFTFYRVDPVLFEPYDNKGISSSNGARANFFSTDLIRLNGGKAHVDIISSFLNANINNMGIPGLWAKAETRPVNYIKLIPIAEKDRVTKLLFRPITIRFRR